MKKLQPKRPDPRIANYRACFWKVQRVKIFSNQTISAWFTDITWLHQSTVISTTPPACWKVQGLGSTLSVAVPRQRICYKHTTQKSIWAHTHSQETPIIQLFQLQLLPSSSIATIQRKRKRKQKDGGTKGRGECEVDNKLRRRTDCLRETIWFNFPLNKIQLSALHTHTHSQTQCLSLEWSFNWSRLRLCLNEIGKLNQL